MIHSDPIFPPSRRPYIAHTDSNLTFEFAITVFIGHKYYFQCANALYLEKKRTRQIGSGSSFEKLDFAADLRQCSKKFKQKQVVYYLINVNILMVYRFTTTSYFHHFQFFRIGQVSSTRLIAENVILYIDVSTIDESLLNVG